MFSIPQYSIPQKPQTPMWRVTEHTYDDCNSILEQLKNAKLSDEFEKFLKDALCKSNVVTVNIEAPYGTWKQMRRSDNIVETLVNRFIATYGVHNVTYCSNDVKGDNCRFNGNPTNSKWRTVVNKFKNIYNLNHASLYNIRIFNHVANDIEALLNVNDYRKYLICELEKIINMGVSTTLVSDELNDIRKYVNKANEEWSTNFISDKLSSPIIDVSEVIATFNDVLDWTCRDYIYGFEIYSNDELVHSHES